MKKSNQSVTSSRRKFLQKSSMLLGGTLLMESFKANAFKSLNDNIVPPDFSTNIGNWLYTANGLPVYQYTGILPFYATDKNGKDALLPDDPYFILGNYTCTLFAHASGIVQFLTGERAWARINAGEQINYGSNAAKIWVIDKSETKNFDLVGLHSSGADSSVTKRYFGTGFARYEYTLPNKIECTRILSVKPSPEIHQGHPCLAITVKLKNNSSKKVSLGYEEKIAMNYLPVNLQRKEESKRLVSYSNKITADAKNETAICSIKYSPKTFLTEHTKDDSNFFDVLPPSVFMSVKQNNNSNITCNASKDEEEEALCASINATILPGESHTYTIVIGLLHDEDFSGVTNMVKDFFIQADLQNPSEGLFINLWKKQLPDFSLEANDVFKREMYWNAYTLEAMATYSSYFKETYVPQGMLYTYQDGENISNRDHAQAVLPLCYTNPPLAKSSLRYVMQHSTWLGEIKRGTGGFGYVEPGVYEESDEQLYLFMAVAEYLRITNDYTLLEETVFYYPLEYQKRDTVINLLKKHFVYLRDVVGIGKNGLVKILNSDWSDSFFHKYSPNIYASAAESVLNTTMALAVLPNFLSVIKKLQDPKLSSFIAAIEDYHKQLLNAFLADFGNRDFAARCYLNIGTAEKLGMDNVCIEPQGYLLQIPELPVERKRMIYNKVKQATSAPEKIGFRTREKPLWGSGEGEDGGIWFSLNGSVIAGVITFDKKEAWTLLERAPFHNFSKQYPDYWVGAWTAPDYINSSLSSKEGIYGFWEPELKNVFMAYCTHPHAWPLYLYYKLKE